MINTLTLKKLTQLLFLAGLGVFLILPQVGEAKTQDGGVWSTTYNTQPLYYYWSGNLTGFGSCCGWEKGLVGPHVEVNYQANIYNQSQGGSLVADNDVIPVGTVLKFEPKPFESEDVYWFGTGYSQDSPNGHWIANAGVPDTAGGSFFFQTTQCNNQDFVGTTAPGLFGAKYDVYSPLSINPPVVSVNHTGTAGLTCDASKQNCTVTSPGTIGTTFTFASTYAQFYYRYANEGDSSCVWQNVPMATQSDASGKTTPDATPFSIAVPTQTVSFTLTATGGAATPATGCTVEQKYFNDADGLVDMRGAAECIANNYLAVSEGGTAQFGNYKSCTSSTLVTGDYSDIGACFGVIKFTPSSGPANRCVVDTFECAQPAGGSCTPVGYDVTTLQQYTAKKQQCVTDGYTDQQFETDHEQGDVPFVSGTGCLVSWDFGTGFKQAFYLNPSCPANQPPSCTDGIQNQDETGVDTGGVCAAANQPPATPTLTGSDTTVNTPANLTVIADDPDGTTIKYGLTDASCGAPYQWIPGDGSLTVDNFAQPFTKNYLTAGQYTVYAFAVDAGGVRSPSCGSYVINVNPAPVATADLKINNSDGPLDVPKNTAVTLTWTSANAASCTMFGEGMGPAGTSVPLNSIGMPVTITQTGNFAVSCDTASDQVTANVVNRAPEQPTISHDTGSAPFNTPTTFRIQGNDPDGDNVFYEVDFNTDDSDGFNTTTGGGPNNSIQTTNRAFTTSGPQTIRARTVDVPHGLRSTWGTYTINIDNPPPPTATLQVSINNGPYTSGDQTINPGDTITMQWGSQNAATCTGTGPGFDTGNSPSGQDGVTPPNPNTSTTFTATCTGGGGSGGATITITTRQLPNFNKPLVTISSLGTFDPATATYSYVDIYFSTANDGGSDTRSAATYTVELTGHPTDSGTIGSGLTPGPAGFNRTLRIPGPITLGSAPVKVSIDTPIASNGSVAEVTEGDADNTNTTTLAVPPPDPGLSLTADRGRVRLEETTVLRFRTTISWAALTCRLMGPGINEAVPLSGTKNTLPIFAKSEYVFSCVDGITGTKWSKTVLVETTGTIEEI